MKRLMVFAAGAVLVALSASPAEAQPYRWDVGLNGGYSVFTRAVNHDETAGISDDANVRFRDGWLVGGQFTFWPTGRVGLRANATYSDRPLRGRAPGASADSDMISNVNLWSGTGDVMIRLANPESQWDGIEWLPFFAVGVGAKWINPAGDRHQITVDGTTRSGNAFTVQGTPIPATETTLAMPSQTRVMGLLGIGTDVRLAPNVGLRLELNDRIYRPEVFIVESAIPDQFQATHQGRNFGRLVHEVSAQVGLHLIGGLRPAPVVAVAPAPPPPPPPAPPPPPPAPREDEIMVCVIDPNAPGGIRMQRAVFRHATTDTMVVIDGQRVPLRQAVATPGVMVARDADWYVRGQPLTLTVGTQRMEFLTYEAPRQIDAERLTYLGRVNGFPVYADRDQVQHVAGQITTAHTAHPDHNLAVMLADRRELRDAIADVPVLYVPMQAHDCIFQAVIRQEDIRK